MMRSLVAMLVPFLVACAGPAAAREAAQARERTKVFSAESEALAAAINAYRAQRGLPSIEISPALMTVAEAHVADLIDNDPVGGQCNFHSWSDRGSWSGCCYTDDHAAAQCMWDKPRELSSYPGNGYEIAVGGGSDLTIERTIASWDGSTPHRNVLLNEGTWQRPWGAFGTAMRGRWAVAWFGHEPDR
jgi:hypothetical protein